MRALLRFGTIFNAVAAAATLSACAGAASSVPTTGRPPSAATRVAHPSARSVRGTAFVSDRNNMVVDVIDRAGNVAALSVPGAAGVAVDSSGKLYVATAAYSGEVLVYDPPYVGGAKVLSGAGVNPVGVAVDRQGNVAVTSTGSSSGGLGGVVFYAKGSRTPTNAIAANAKFAGDYYCAFDANGNLYLDSKNGSGPFEAGEIVGGITGKSVTALTTKNLVQYPSGMQVTSNGDIAILNAGSDGSAATIYTYHPPRGQSLGNPVKQTQLAASNNAVAFAFAGASDKSAFTGDTYYDDNPTGVVRHDHQNQIGQAQWFEYPSGGEATRSIRLAYNATILGVAVNPAEAP